MFLTEISSKRYYPKSNNITTTEKKLNLTNNKKKVDVVTLGYCCFTAVAVNVHEQQPEIKSI